MKRFITTTLPYSNGPIHCGAAFEFVLADVIAGFWRQRYGRPEDVRLNIGLDEHGQKIAQKAKELGLDPQVYCDQNAEEWISACESLGISYDRFYRTSDPEHKKNVLRFTEQLAPFIFESDYTGLYCVGCEAYKTEREVIGGRCSIHGHRLTPTTERVKCFDIKRFAASVEDRLVDKSLSNELKNILANDFDFPITRQNVEWAIPFEGGTLHCWWEALTNYVFAAGLYDEGDDFSGWWANSLQLCGKDNLKFQAYIFQAMLLAAGLSQSKEVLVHGIILDEKNKKMSKSDGNVVDPIAQLKKYGRGALRYYLTLGLNTYGDTAFSEGDLVKIWNTEVIGGFGNLVARILHHVDTLDVNVEDELKISIDSGRYDAHRELIDSTHGALNKAFEAYDFFTVRKLLNEFVSALNRRINDERPFDPATPDRKLIVAEIFKGVQLVAKFYSIILKDERIAEALEGRKKVILFDKLTVDIFRSADPGVTAALKSDTMFVLAKKDRAAYERHAGGMDELE